MYWQPKLCAYVFFPSHLFLHHWHLTWTWKFWGLEIFQTALFRSKSHSEVLKSNMDKNVISSIRLERDETILFLYSWNITLVSQHPWSVKYMVGFCTKHELTGIRLSCTSQLPGMIAGDRSETMTGHMQMKPLCHLYPYIHSWNQIPWYFTEKSDYQMHETANDIPKYCLIRQIYKWLAVFWAILLLLSFSIPFSPPLTFFF